MIPRDAVVMDKDGDLWTCMDGRWYCATQQDIHGSTAEQLLADLGPLDVLVWRNRINPKDNL